MKNTKITICFFILSLIFTSGVIPDNLGQTIKKQEAEWTNRLKIKLTQENIFNSGKKLNIKAFPVFSIKINPLNNQMNNDDLKFEKGPNFFIIEHDSTTYYLDNYFFDQNDVDIKFKLEKQSPFTKAINFAVSKSDSVFLLYSIGIPIIGYIEKGKLRFIDINLKIHESLVSFVVYRFGSVENYKDEIKRRQFEDRYLEKVKTFEEAKLIYRNNWFNCFKYSIYDSIVLSNAVIFQVEEFEKITDYQQTEFKVRLAKAIREYRLDRKDIKKLSFNELADYNEIYIAVIKNELKQCLLFDEYWTFISNEELYQQLSDKAEYIINSHYKNDLKNTNDSLLSKLILKEVFLVNE